MLGGGGGGGVLRVLGTVPPVELVRSEERSREGRDGRGPGAANPVLELDLLFLLKHFLCPHRLHSVKLYGLFPAGYTLYILKLLLPRGHRGIINVAFTSYPIYIYVYICIFIYIYVYEFNTSKNSIFMEGMTLGGDGTSLLVAKCDVLLMSSCSPAGVQLVYSWGYL